MKSWRGPVHWLIVDDKIKHAEEIALAIHGIGGKADIVHDLRSAEKALRRNLYDACVVDCFYEGSKKTGEDLIPALRHHNVSIPIIMASSSPDPELPERVVEAGADIFINKLTDHFSFACNLKTAFIQARTFRKIRSLKLVARRSEDIYLTSEIWKKVEAGIRTDGNIVVVGSSGSGKTGVAKLIAEGSFDRLSENVRRLDCATLDRKGASDFLFGSKDQAGFLHCAPGGAVILESVDSLDSRLQSRLKEFFSDTQPLPEDNVNRTKFIFTAQATHSSGQLVSGLFETIADREIVLPTLQDIGVLGHLSAALAHTVASEIKSRDCESVRFDESALTPIETAVRSRAWENNFRGLRKSIREAIEIAIEDGRTKVLLSDFEKALSRVRPETRTPRSVDDGIAKILNDIDCKDLLRAIRDGKDLKSAYALLEKMMFKISAKKFENNISKMSEALGVSRPAVYRMESQYGEVCDA